MIELETMLMQFCLETSGRLNGDRYPVGKGEVLRSLLAAPRDQVQGVSRGVLLPQWTASGAGD
jgi:hypothetical protein